MTYLLGLTGSIGMGKSTTARLFAERGIPVWDADAAVHRLYGPAGAGTEALRGLVPSAVGENGVDRAALKALLKGAPDLLKDIEAVIHPLVAQDRAEFIAKTQAEILVFDIPLLFELGSEESFDGVAVVSAPAHLQKKRVLARDGMTEETFSFILAKQMPDAEKRERATFIIDTSSHDAARADVETIIETIKGRQAHA